MGLRYDDAHIEEGYFKVMGKGLKERIVSIGGLTQKMLWRYVIHFRIQPLVEVNKSHKVIHCTKHLIVTLLSSIS